MACISKMPADDPRDGERYRLLAGGAAGGLPRQVIAFADAIGLTTAVVCSTSTRTSWPRSSMVGRIMDPKDLVVVGATSQVESWS
jgi:hypothetical protein